jgi:hypothetical protein|eukprot:COSAG01_NODE_11542_length_1908_cov_2.459923_1_plen_92_part_00
MDPAGVPTVCFIRNAGAWKLATITAKHNNMGVSRPLRSKTVSQTAISAALKPSKQNRALLLSNTTTITYGGLFEYIIPKPGCSYITVQDIP